MCTGLRFTDTANNLYFGRNLDLDENNYGEQPILAPEGYEMQYRHMPAKKLSTAIIGMGVNAGGYPLFFEACSARGMGIAGLNFPRNAYFAPEGDQTKKYNVTPYEFMVWALDEFESVAELREALKDTYLIGTDFAPGMPLSPLHWIISDANETIVVEQTKEKGLMVYENNVDVLTNNPEFPWHVQNLNNYIGLSANDRSNTTWNRQELQFQGIGTGQLGLPGDSSTQSRFVKTAFLNANYPTQEGEEANVARMFNTLMDVAMPYGSVINEHGAIEFTIYTSCYSQATQTYYYHIWNEAEIKHASITDENRKGTEIVTFEK